jgi:hypothetical protein
MCFDNKSNVREKCQPCVQDWYARVQAALRGLVRTGEVHMMDGFRFRLDHEDADAGVEKHGDGGDGDEWGGDGDGEWGGDDGEWGGDDGDDDDDDAGVVEEDGDENEDDDSAESEEEHDGKEERDERTNDRDVTAVQLGRFYLDGSARPQREKDDGLGSSSGEDDDDVQEEEEEGGKALRGGYTNARASKPSEEKEEEEEEQESEEEEEEEEEEEDPFEAHEVTEHEAEGDEGWNQDGDGWVNLVKDDDEDHHHHHHDMEGEGDVPALAPYALNPNAAPWRDVGDVDRRLCAPTSTARAAPAAAAAPAAVVKWVHGDPPGERCERSDGKKWRCGSKKAPGCSYCSHHNKHTAEGKAAAAEARAAAAAARAAAAAARAAAAAEARDLAAGVGSKPTHPKYEEMITAAILALKVGLYIC